MMNWYGHVLHSSLLAPAGYSLDEGLRDTVRIFAHAGQTIEFDEPRIEQIQVYLQRSIFDIFQAIFLDVVYFECGPPLL